MRTMATSDLHGNLDGLGPTGADVVVLAGDVAPLRGRGPRHINLSRLDERYETACEPAWQDV